MLEETALAGTWTWDGTTTILSTDTSGIVVGDYIKQAVGDSYFKVNTVNVGVSVIVDDPGDESIPNGAPTTAFKTEEGIRDEILVAGDVVNTPVTEPVTEPSSAPGTTRKIAEEDSSVTVQVGKKYRRDYAFRELPSSDSWGALTGMEESIV